MRPQVITSLTHMATQSMPTVSCLSIRKAIFSLVPTPSVPDTSTGCVKARSYPARTSRRSRPARQWRRERHGARHMLFHQFHSSVAGRDVHTGRLVALRKALFHLFLPFCPAAFSRLRRLFCVQIWISAAPAAAPAGYSPVKQPAQKSQWQFSAILLRTLHAQKAQAVHPESSRQSPPWNGWPAIRFSRLSISVPK